MRVLVLHSLFLLLSVTFVLCQNLDSNNNSNNRNVRFRPQVRPGRFRPAATPPQRMLEQQNRPRLRRPPYQEIRRNQQQQQQQQQQQLYQQQQQQQQQQQRQQHLQQEEQERQHLQALHQQQIEEQQQQLRQQQLQQRQQQFRQQQQQQQQQQNNEFQPVPEAPQSPSLPEVQRPRRRPQDPPPPAQSSNVDQSPVLVRGHDLDGFEIREDAKVGEEVYRLEGRDPEGGQVTYTISGDWLSVDENTGSVKLRDSLDRESNPGDSFKVVVTVADNDNIVPFKRTVRVLDVNDNSPKFSAPSYTAELAETSPVGTVVTAQIGVTDSDLGPNSKIEVQCMDEEEGSCGVFSVQAQELSPGSYIVVVRLEQQLDFERRSSYAIKIRALDSPTEGERLSAEASLFIKVLDIQDQGPVFVNAPYSATVQENTPPGSAIFQVMARDGDTGRPRNLQLRLEDDDQGLFELRLDNVNEEDGMHYATVVASTNTIDREKESILSEGGLYTFRLVATEVVPAGDEIPSETASADVTIVVTDQNDQIPMFNQDEYRVAVPEDVGSETPLPDLNMVVIDADVSSNAEFYLQIEDAGSNAEGVFEVYPTRAVGRTPVIIRVSNPERLDYETEQGRNFEFKVNALQGLNVLSSATVHVMVTDSNDNVPVFGQEAGYSFAIREDAPPGTSLGSVSATDADSGRFGQVEYSLRGFGAERFLVDALTGEVTVAECGLGVSRCLDYETRDGYALTVTATDGGGQVTTNALSISVMDVNDNFPVFEQPDGYLRVVEEGDTEFVPELTVQATDKDGPAQGGGQIYYSLHSINTEATVFDVDPVTGDIRLIQPANSEDTESGQYDLVIRATDAGEPPLFTDVQVTVKVGSISNQKPRFLTPFYEARIREDSRAGMEVTKVKAEDPDGPQGGVRYIILSGSKDNFILDRVSGLLSVAPEANLDIQRNGDTYEIIVQAVDSGKPYGRTTEATVTVFIQDVNNKKPQFEHSSYAGYVLESSPVGSPVLQVSAFDPDRSASIAYSIVEPITAKDKTGNEINNRAAYDYSKAFAVDPTTGQIVVNEPLSHSSAAVIVLTVEAEDMNADEKFPNQTVTAEATLFVQAFRADAPQFSSPWTPSDPVLKFDIDEELPAGSVLFTLSAQDPVTGQPITHFEKVAESDPHNLFSISPLTGEVINNGVLDYDSQGANGADVNIRFSVLAAAPSISNEVEGDQMRVSEARVIVRLVDVDDNPPIFEQQEYQVEISESVLPMTPLIQVRATDLDSGMLGLVQYSLESGHGGAFKIDKDTGEITVKAGPDGRSMLDRETTDEYQITVAASAGGGQQKRHTGRTRVNVVVLDSNDTPPWFSQPRYSAVVAENAEIGTKVLEVGATDPDEGEGGMFTFNFPEGANGDLFRIDSETGEIFTAADLTGKGRQTPYILTIRASDFGSESLFSDTEVLITVGDVSSNDGVPTFQAPKVNEVAYVAENASAGSSVFQVRALDPDDPTTSAGKVVYSLPDDGTIVSKLFQIHPESGIISTKVRLDREERDEYTLIVNAHDLGSPPQQTSRVLKVKVTDIDDHPPVFSRQRNSVPKQMEITEESDIGTVVGQVTASDADDADNAVVEFAIIDGDEGGVFEIESGQDDSRTGIIRIARRVDRERRESYLLTIKCFRPYERNVKSIKKSFDNMQLDEMQVRINVKDIDDNSPKFVNRNMTVGVRVNSPVYTRVAQVKAEDMDNGGSDPVHYEAHNLTYYRDRTNTYEIMDDTSLFTVDSSSGLIQTAEPMGRFADGYFVLFIKASNGPEDKREGDTVPIRILVLQDTDLLRFVFDRDPNAIRDTLPDFKRDVEQLLKERAASEELIRTSAVSAVGERTRHQLERLRDDLSVQLHETEFYSKVDGSIDFGRTSSCFRLMSGDFAVDPSSSQAIFDYSRSPDLKDLLDKYNVVNIERCAMVASTAGVNWVQICLLIIAGLIGLVAIIAAIATCCLYSSYKKSVRRSQPVKIVEAPVRAYVPTSLPPGSIAGGPTMGGGAYDWQESTIPMDATSYRSFPNQ